MFDLSEYTQIVARARDVLTFRTGDVLISARSTYAEGYRWYTVLRDADVNREVQLYYRLNDLYIRGFRVGSFGYRFRGAEGFEIGGGVVNELSYGDSYADMGWNGNPPLRITIENLQSALYNLQGSRSREPAAISMLRVVVAFSDGVRLSDIVHHIYQGKPITRDMLDWARRTRQAGGNIYSNNIQVVKGS